MLFTIRDKRIDLALPVVLNNLQQQNIAVRYDHHLFFFSNSRIKMRTVIYKLPVWLAILSHIAYGFTTQSQPHSRTIATTSMASSSTVSEWENLLPDVAAAPVRKSILEGATDGEIPTKGSTVTIEYSGSLWMKADDGIGCSIASWDTDAVVDCWLSEQQGLLEILEGPFREHGIDGSKLLDENYFTEALVGETLGVDNKIKCKKTIMAAKRLRSTLEEYEDGLVFDSTATKADKSYSFVLGAGKTIKAMELLVASMQVGESARVVTRCDYGYGADGCRTSKGDVLVPPFCGLQFDVKLVSIE